MEKKFNTEKIAPDSRGLRFLYRTFFGRTILAILSWRFISKIAGRFLDTRLSKPMIARFIKKNNISAEEFELDDEDEDDEFDIRTLKTEDEEFAE